MTNLNSRSIAVGLVLALSLFACHSLEAGVISGSQVSGPVTFGTATPGSYNFFDFGDGSFQATLATFTLTGTSTGVVNLDTNSTPDYPDGDRILLSVTNSTGVSLSGITFGITGTTFLGDAIDPSRGTFSSNTYTSDPNQRVNSADDDVSATSTSASFIFDSILASGSTTYFYLQASDNGALAGGFDLSETASTAAGAAGVPEPAMFLPLGLALVGLTCLRRRFGN